MLATEARAVIINHDPAQAADLRRMVIGQGGDVIGEIPDFLDAVDAIVHADFPHNLGDPNVVLLDGNMRPGNTNGADGRDLFLLGRRAGRLHEVSTLATGVLALGTSVQRDAEVNMYTGALVRDQSPRSWRQYLLQHEANPQFMPQGAMTRGLLGGVPLRNGLPIPFQDSRISRVVSVRQTAVPQTTDALPMTNEVGAESLAKIGSTTELQTAMEGLVIALRSRLGEKRILNRSVIATVLTSSGLVIFRQIQRPNPTAVLHGIDVLSDGAFDVIPYEHFASIPDLYWHEQQVDPEQLTAI